MQKKWLLFTLVVGCAMCASCTKISHSLNSVASGKVFRFGTPECSLLYVNGTLVTSIVRENSEIVVETNDGDSVSNPSGVFKGLKSIRFRTAGQATGYLKDLAKKDPAAAKAYIKAMPELCKPAWDTKYENPIEAPLIQSAPLQTVTEKIKSAVEPFTCPNGNCELTNLWKDNRIVYQTAVVNKLLTYADETSGWAGEVTPFKQTLNMFLTRMAQLTAKGKTTTCMRVKYARIKDGKLVDLNYIMIEDDGREFDTHCPECVLLED